MGYIDDCEVWIYPSERDIEMKKKEQIDQIYDDFLKLVADIDVRTNIDFIIASAIKVTKKKFEDCSSTQKKGIIKGVITKWANIYPHIPEKDKQYLLGIFIPESLNHIIDNLCLEKKTKWCNIL